jgi:hypothetical protein
MPQTLRATGVIGLGAFVALFLPAAAQTVTADVVPIGAVQVGNHEASLVIAYAEDAAILMLAVEGVGGTTGFIPLFASTYRGIPTVTVDILATRAGDAVWVQSSLAANEVLAFYRFDESTAVTGFGTLDLLSAPLPQTLSGGVGAFPAFDPQAVQKLASFYFP